MNTRPHPSPSRAPRSAARVAARRPRGRRGADHVGRSRRRRRRRGRLRVCQVVWFDAGELEALPAPPEPDDVPPELAPARARGRSLLTRRELLEDDAAWTRTPWLVYVTVCVPVARPSRTGSARRHPSLCPARTSRPPTARSAPTSGRATAARLGHLVLPDEPAAPQRGGPVRRDPRAVHRRHRNRAAPRPPRAGGAFLAGNVAACLTYLLASPSSDIPLRGTTSGLTAAVTSGWHSPARTPAWRSRPTTRSRASPRVRSASCGCSASRSSRSSRAARGPRTRCSRSRSSARSSGSRRGDSACGAIEARRPNPWADPLAPRRSVAWGRKARWPFAAPRVRRSALAP